MKGNRPVNLDMGQVLAVNLKSPVAIGSILHRISGVALFLCMPLVLWLLQRSLASPDSFNAMVVDVRNSILIRFGLWVFTAALWYHLVMGIKHLLADAGVAEGLQSGRTAATVALVIAAIGIVLSIFWVMF